MRWTLIAAALMWSFFAGQLALAQTENEVSKARAKLYLEEIRHPSSWEKISNEELLNPASGLRCAATFSGFVLQAISSAPNGAMCEWGRSSDSAGVVVAVLEVGSYSLEQMAQIASNASTQRGAFQKVLPIEISYNGCPAMRFDAWDHDVFKGRITLVQKEGHFWTVMAKEVESSGREGDASATDEVFKIADAYVGPQLKCEAFG